jgi:hypothetical protein
MIMLGAQLLVVFPNLFVDIFWRRVLIENLRLSAIDLGLSVQGDDVEVGMLELNPARIILRMKR